jgi:hypothetical protein
VMGFSSVIFSGWNYRAGGFMLYRKTKT